MNDATWHLKQCPGWPAEGRHIEQVRDENGIGTPHVICQSHGELVGHITRGEKP